MATIPEAFALGVQHHQAGQLQAAEQIYRQILQVDPYHPEALHLLGFLYHQAGRHDLAVDYINQAILLSGKQAPFHHNLGDAYRALGRFPDAVACYQNALKLKPDLLESQNNLGLTYQEQGQLDLAAASFQSALQLSPGDFDIHNNLVNVFLNQGRNAEALAVAERALNLQPSDASLHNKRGVALKRLGRLDEAVETYQQALQLSPGLFETHYNLGVLLQDKGQMDEAEAKYRAALQWNPNFAQAYCALGIVLKEQGKLDLASAYLRHALKLQPNSPDAYCNLGSVYKDLGRLDEAIACQRQALALKPDFAEAFNNLGNALGEQGSLDEATESLRKALIIKPDFAMAYNNLGNALVKKGIPGEATECYQKALALQPDNLTYLAHLIHQRQHVCQWENLTNLSQQLIEGIDREFASDKAAGVPSFSFLVLPTPTTAAQQLRCAQMESLKFNSLPALHSPAGRRAKEKITLGYLSGDYQLHATAYLIAELFEKHDRDRFEVIGYGYGPDDGSAMRQRLLAAFDKFVDLRDVSFQESAQRIAADEVDILIDLKGYAGATRPAILAMRPASIQVNYLGYPGTMGAPFMDYILVDNFIVPDDQQPYFTEKLIHLPGCYQINDSKREIASHTPTRAECDLPAEGFVFCDFNNSYKITPEVFSIWMELLKEVPGSVLWLLEGNSAVAVNLRREAEVRGVARDRLIFAAKKPMAEHLARHRLADLFLDTFPVCAHTTASDALWAGCPLLTLAGATFIARVAGSLLRTIGLPELITTSFDEYKAQALRLARDAQMLADLRARLSDNRLTSNLFDSTLFTRNLEKAYARMWESKHQDSSFRARFDPDAK
jgi:protein O-GlcNAc transferase